MSTEKKYGSWIRAGFYGGLQKLSIPLSGLFITMILAHKTLSKQEMGVWALFMTITSIIEVIRQGMVKTALIKYFNQDDGAHKISVVSAALFLNIMITVILSLLILFFTPLLSSTLKAPQLSTMLYLLQLGIFLMIPFSHFEWIMYAKAEFKGLFWTYLYRQGTTLLFIFLAFVIGFKLSLNQLALIYILGLLIGTFAAAKYVGEFIGKSFSFSKKWILQLFHFGKFVFANNINAFVFRSADQFMLSPLLGTTEFNASQNIAVRFINLSDLPSQTLGDILFPKASNMNKENKGALKYYYEKTVGASLLVVIPVIAVVMLFPHAIIYVLAGPQYYDAIPYLQLISVTSIFLAYLKQFGVIMDSTGSPGINYAANTAIAIIQVILLYFFISKYQFIGTGYALVVSHIIGFIISQTILYRNYKINFLNAFKYAYGFLTEIPQIVSGLLNKRK